MCGERACAKRQRGSRWNARRCWILPTIAVSLMCRILTGHFEPSLGKVHGNGRYERISPDEPRLERGKSPRRQQDADRAAANREASTGTLPTASGSGPSYSIELKLALRSGRNYLTARTRLLS